MMHCREQKEKRNKRNMYILNFMSVQDAHGIEMNGSSEKIHKFGCKKNI